MICILGLTGWSFSKRSDTFLATVIYHAMLSSPRCWMALKEAKYVTRCHVTFHYMSLFDTDMMQNRWNCLKDDKKLYFIIVNIMHDAWTDTGYYRSWLSEPRIDGVKLHVDLMTHAHLPHYWPFVWGIHRLYRFIAQKAMKVKSWFLCC